MSSSDSSRISEIINLLIDIKSAYRQTTPHLPLDERSFQKIKTILIKLNGLLANLNENFGIKPQSEAIIQLDVKKALGTKLFVVNSPKNRKKLIDLGLNADQIVATGGPIFENDIKLINPNIPENAYQTIQIKIQKFWKTIQTRIKEEDFNKVVLLIEEENVADKILLKRKDDLRSRLSLPIQYITISSFEQIDDSTLASLNED